jgi:hypothetical protein
LELFWMKIRTEVIASKKYYSKKLRGCIKLRGVRRALKILTNIWSLTAIYAHAYCLRVIYWHGVENLSLPFTT